MRIQLIERPFAASSGPTVGMLFSTRQATTQASQPVHRSRSIPIAHLGFFVLVSSVIDLLSSLLHLLPKIRSESDEVCFTCDPCNSCANRFLIRRFQHRWVPASVCWIS